MRNELFLLFAFLCAFHLVNGQVRNPTAVATGASEYVGWDGTGGFSKDLDIVNLFTGQNINIFNNGNVTNYVMRIIPNGNIGFGDVASPQSHMHSHSGNANNTFQMTNQFTGNGVANSGFTIDVDNGDGTVRLQNWTNAPIAFQTVDQWLTTDVIRAEFTTGGAMLENSTAAAANPPDGFRIWNPGYPLSNTGAAQAIDIWTGGSSSTHMRFDESGLFQGINLHFEQFARLEGFWFNAAPLANQAGAFRGRYFFNIDSIEVSRYSNASNANRGFMRVGLQPAGGSPGTAGVDAARRLEVYDNNTSDPQFRITQTDGTVYTDFQTRNTGDLYINPRSGSNDRRIGVNIQGPQATVDVRGVNAGNLPQLRLTQISGGSGMYTDFQTSTAGNLNIRPQGNGNERNVGINVASPAAKLHIQGDNGVSNFRISNSTALQMADITDDAIFTFNSKKENATAFTFSTAPTAIGSVLGMKMLAISSTNATGNLEAGYFYANDLASSGTGLSTIIGITAKAETNVTSSLVNVRAFNGIAIANQSAQTVTAGYFDANGSGANHYAVTGVTSPTTGHCFAINGDANVQDLTKKAYGGHFLAQGNGVEHYGVWAKADGSTGINYAVDANAIKTGPDYNYGVRGVADNGSIANYSIYGEAPSGTSSSNNTAGFFNGDVYCPVGSTFGSSDVKLKTNIQDLSNASQLLSQFQPKTYDFLYADYPALNLPTTHQYGLIAQDVENILPQMVREFVAPEKRDSLGNITAPSFDFKGVNYGILIPILVAAFNEQQNKIDSLITALNGGAPRNFELGNQNIGQKVTLTDVQAVVLNQNDPNPFTESTRITYVVPPEVGSAKIIFTNSVGSIINTVEITERGSSELQVFSSELSSGIYTYTLVCDGKITSSKKMVKQ